jgi:hypothetical protein
VPVAVTVAMTVAMRAWTIPTLVLRGGVSGRRGGATLDHNRPAFAVGHYLFMRLLLRLRVLLQISPPAMELAAQLSGWTVLFGGAPDMIGRISFFVSWLRLSFCRLLVVAAIRPATSLHS